MPLASPKQLWVLNRDGRLLVTEEKGKPILPAEADAAIKAGLEASGVTEFSFALDEHAQP